MSTDLREQLEQLASGMPSPARPRDLWERGVRRRRRRASTLAAVAVVLLLLAGLGGAAWWSLSPLPTGPAAPRSAAAIPDRLDVPSSWSRGTDDDGPLGQLAVLGTAPRHTGLFTTTSSPYGVSATTGTYRWLDLPDRAADSPDDPAVLSPDGRHVGYWLRGRTARPGSGIVGFAVYDTTTGRVVRHRVRSPAGLAEERLAWFGTSRLVVSWSQVVRVTRNGSLVERGSFGYLWSPDSETLVPFAHGSSTFGAWGSTRRPVSWDGGGRRFWLWDPTTLTLRAFRVPTGALQSVSVSPDGKRAALDLGTTYPWVVSLGDAGLIHPRRASGQVTGNPLGWRDAEHVAFVDPGDNAYRVQLIDLRTGASRGELASTEFLSQSEFASDLWARPLAQRPGPTWVPGPWVTSAFLFLAGVVALCVVVAVKGRRRDRA